MRVSHETIYLSLFVQARGALRKELFRCLRTGRAHRRPRGLTVNNGQGKIRGRVSIAERRAEAADRAVPGHWEGGIIFGTGRSTIATLAGRRSRFVMLVALPRGLAMLVGALVGIPGAAYLTALHNLVTGKSSTATQVLAVVIFVLIEFALIIIPFVFLELRPEGTKAALKNAQDWLLGHARQLMAYTAMILGAYLTISALIRLG
jgi:Sap, sulfolipid-1-addressing protein